MRFPQDEHSPPHDVVLAIYETTADIEELAQLISELWGIPAESAWDVKVEEVIFH